jgi:hypothetical protein
VLGIEAREHLKTQLRALIVRCGWLEFLSILGELAGEANGGNGWLGALNRGSALSESAKQTATKLKNLNGAVSELKRTVISVRQTLDDMKGG